MATSPSRARTTSWSPPKAATSSYTATGPRRPLPPDASLVVIVVIRDGGGRELRFKLKRPSTESEPVRERQRLPGSPVDSLHAKPRPCRQSQRARRPGQDAAVRLDLQRI